jgi:hypothetical protein
MFKVFQLFYRRVTVFTGHVSMITRLEVLEHIFSLALEITTNVSAYYDFILALIRMKIVFFIRNDFVAAMGTFKLKFFQC